MSFEFIPAAYVAHDLGKKIMTATFDIENEWFFFDGAFNYSTNIQTSVNTWSNENFVAVYNDEIIAYFEGVWSRPLDIISSFRTINFNKKYSNLFALAFLRYLEHLFVNRNCNAFGWCVALQNERAAKQSARFTRDYCGHYVGLRHHSQKSYAGKISDVNMYEITQEEFFDWKNRRYKKRDCV